MQYQQPHPGQQHQQHHHHQQQHHQQQPRAQNGYNPGTPVRVSAIKHEFDLTRKDWVKKPTTINVTRPAGYFDAGGMRVCFFVQEVEDDGFMSDCVAKFFKTDIPDVVHADYLNEAMAQCLSEEFAQNFNKLDTPKKISFLNCVVIEVDERDMPPLHLLPRNNFFTFRTQDTKKVVFCMEPKLNGEFTKYNSNFGDCYANNKRDAKKGSQLDSVFVSAEAFSHFTLQESGGSFLVCDLQGVEDLLTDPQIHTEEGKGLGMGNMGQEGIDKWVASHKCNDICRRLQLKSYNEILNPLPPAHVIQAAQGGPPQASSSGGAPPPATSTTGGGPPPPGGEWSAPSHVNPNAAQKPPSSQSSQSSNQPPPPPANWNALYSGDSSVGAPRPAVPPAGGPPGGQAPPLPAQQAGSRSRYHELTSSMYNGLEQQGIRPSMRPSQRHLFNGQQPQPQQQRPPQAVPPQNVQAQPFPGHQPPQPQARPGATGTFLPTPAGPGPAPPQQQQQQQQQNPYNQNAGQLGYGPGGQQSYPPQQGGMVAPAPFPHPQARPIPPPVTQPQVVPQQQQQQQQQPSRPGQQQQQPQRDVHQMTEEEQLAMILERSKIDR